jgi:acyl-CoA dehydrogenase
VSAVDAPPAFSLELDEGQRTLRDWLAGFARDLLRPNGAEWDRRGETPWEIIAEAARLGVYGTEMLDVFLSDRNGLVLPIYAEELFFGDAVWR